MTEPAAIAVFTGLALLAPAPARAQLGDVDVTSTTSVEWHTDNDDDDPANDNYGEATQRLNAVLTHDHWNAGLRIDATTFAAPVAEPGEEAHGSRADLEKIWAGWTGRSVAARVGDSYVSFGRGLALSLRKVDELGLDTTLRGGKLLVHHGDAGFTAVAGTTNITNVDESSGRAMDDPGDVIAGARGELRLQDSKLGGHVAGIWFRDPHGFAAEAGAESGRYAERWLSFGPTFDAPRLTPRLGLYLEGVGQHRADGGIGHGIYGAATYYRGPVTVLVETKAYGDLQVVQPAIELVEFSAVQYSSMPTLERPLQQLDHGQRQTLGTRSRLDWRTSSRLGLAASYALFRDYNGYAVITDATMAPVQVPATIHDPSVGIDARWGDAGSRAAMTGGWRLAVADRTGDRVRSDQYLEIDAARPVAPRVSVELHAIHQERAIYHPPFINQRFREGTTQLGVRWSPALSASAIYDYTTDALQPKTHHLALAAEWRPQPATTLRVMAGSSRGGLKCVSGVCREFAPFEGFKASLTYRH